MRLYAAMLPGLDVRVTVERPDGAFLVASDWTADGPANASARLRGFDLTLRATSSGGGLRLDLSITNIASHAQCVEHVRVSLGGCRRWWTGMGAAPRALRVAYCGAHSRSSTSRSLVTTLPDGEHLSSWWVGALSGPDGPGVVLGGMQPQRFVTWIDSTSDGLTAEVPLEGWQIDAGESLLIDPLWLGVSHAAPLQALEAFATNFGDAMHCDPTSSPSGWGSWGHWLERIDAGLMREMVHAIDGSAPLRDVVDIVQIDDGWSELLDTRRVSASWHPNERFPSGIAPLAAEIARNGRRCGLWLLPFTVNAGSPMVLTHPDWLVQDADGQPFKVGGIETYCLDPTHPNAAAWLAELLQRLREWGIDYFKLDYLRALLAPDPATGVDDFRVRRRYHGARTRLEAYRLGLAVIRRAVGPHATLVSCSAPAAAGAGLIDCHRIGPDIERSWTGRLAGVQDAARSVAANWFWHGRAWTNDPDYLLACESEPLTRFWATVVALSGGSMILSADLSTLEPWAESLLAFVMPPIGIAATPIDLFVNGPEPRHWLLPLERDDSRWTLLGVLNWTDRPVTERLTPAMAGEAGAVHLWDVWRQRHSIATDHLTVPVEAQSAALLRVTPLSDVPTLIGTDVHWAQGWLETTTVVFDRTTGHLRIVVPAAIPRAGRAWIWVPPEWTLVSDTTCATGGLVIVALSGGHEVVVKFCQLPAAPLERNDSC